MAYLHLSLYKKTVSKVTPLQLNSFGVKKKYVDIESHSYGPHPRHMLDFFVSKNTKVQDKLPLVVFVYGGGLTQGGRRLEATQEAVYQNVGIFLAMNGFACVTIDYRLCPQHGAVYPSGGKDISSALDFLTIQDALRDKIDFQRTYLFGTSAGAIHCATYLWCSFEKSPAERINVLKTYFGDDLRKRNLISLRTKSDDTTPTLLLTSQYDLIEEVLEPVRK